VEVRDFAIRRFGSGAYVLHRGINEPLPFFCQGWDGPESSAPRNQAASTVNAGQGG